MYRLFLSLRYFRSRLINIIPVICMMLGVMALIVILAVMDGFQAQLRATLKGSLSDLNIRVFYASDFNKWEKLLLDIDGVEAVAPHLQSFCLVAEIPAPPPPGQPEREAAMDGALVLGIDAMREARVSSFREYLRYRLALRNKGEVRWVSSTPDKDRPFDVLDPRWEDRAGVILGRQLADRVGAHPPRWSETEDGGLHVVYDRVYLTTMVRTDDDRKYRAEQLDFCVTGIYSSGNQEIDQRVAFMDRKVAREFFQLSRDPEEIRVSLADYEGQHERVLEEIGSAAAHERFVSLTKEEGTYWPPGRLGYYVQTWEDRRRNFLNAIQNEKGLIAIIAGMAFVVTGFMIFSILSMIVSMKTRDIGILKALGATTAGVMRIFLLNGFMTGVVGASAGLGLGLLFTKHINAIKEFLNRTFGWEPFPQDIYLFPEIPTQVIASEVAIVTVMALVVALIGALLPALRAARMDPVESLRYE